MFRKTLAAAAVTIALGGLAAPAMATPAAAAVAPQAATSAAEHEVGGVIPISHSNTVTLDSVDVGSMSFSPSGDYSISSGQPWGGVTSQNSGSTTTITAQAGRHASSGPAQFFTGNVSAMVGGNSFSGAPSELNFAFSGTLTLNGTDYPVVIGQGQNAEGNNWWIGGPGWIQNGAGAMVSPDQQFVIGDAPDATGYSENTFTVTAAG